MSNYKCHFLGLFLFMFSSVIQAKTIENDTISTGIILDSLENEVYLIRNKQAPITYYSPIFTPVCLDGTCYPIKINLFWDLTGTYSKYTLDSTEILTKIEHLPFTDFDYGLLHRVIADPNSALANFTIEELVDDSNTKKVDGKKVDGITGATRPELSGSFVPDALYTSYTLWHLARKQKSAIRNYTENNLITPQTTPYLLNHPELGGQQLVLEHLLKTTQNGSYSQTLKPIIDSTDNDLTVACILLLPDSLLRNAVWQQTLSEKFSQAENSHVKSTILNRWKQRSELSEITLIALASSLGNTASTFNTEIDLLKSQPVWPAALYDILLEKMNNTRNMMRKEKIKKLIYSREDEFPRKFKRKMASTK